MEISANRREWDEETEKGTTSTPIKWYGWENGCKKQADFEPLKRRYCFSPLQKYVMNEIGHFMKSELPCDKQKLHRTYIISYAFFDDGQHIWLFKFLISGTYLLTPLPGSFRIAC